MLATLARRCGAPARRRLAAVQQVRGFAAKKGAQEDDLQWIEDFEPKKPNTIYVFRSKPKPSSADAPKRAGLIAMKVGMVPYWDPLGIMCPATVLAVEDCAVVRVRTEEELGYNLVEIGALNAKIKHTDRGAQRVCAAAGVPVKRHFAGFQVDEKGIVPVGTELTCRHFVPGQLVDVQGTTIGKGTQGVMKRWGFGGQPASHGVSKTHRSGGSLGGSQDPGRVWKGKKMAGRMGNKKRTVQNLTVLRLDVERNLIYVKGHVPGNKGNYVRIRDAVKKPATLFTGKAADVPWPTFIPEIHAPDEEEPPKVLDAPPPPRNLLDPMSPVPEA